MDEAEADGPVVMSSHAETMQVGLRGYMEVSWGIGDMSMLARVVLHGQSAKIIIGRLGVSTEADSWDHAARAGVKQMKRGVVRHAR